MIFKPNGNKILVSMLKVAEKIKGTIIIPGTAKQKLYEGFVEATGPGERVKGKRISLTVKKGDKVLFGKGIGIPFDIDNKEYLLMSEGDLFGIYKGFENA